jgi:purine-nucleoside phosphorylase
MLGILDKTLKAYPHSIVNVVFDNLSDLVLSIGFDKTYRFVKYALEILTSPKTTVLFLLNQSAHDPQITSNLRGLFSNQIFFGKEGMQTVKLSKTEMAMIEMETIPVKGE